VTPRPRRTPPSQAPTRTELPEPIRPPDLSPPIPRPTPRAQDLDFGPSELARLTASWQTADPAPLEQMPLATLLLHALAFDHCLPPAAAVLEGVRERLNGLDVGADDRARGVMVDRASLELTVRGLDVVRELQRRGGR
jgi:hypothetical protein